MSDDLKLLGACGLYCGACEHHLGPRCDDPLAHSDQPDAPLCEGCHGHIDAAMYPWCAECTIRACALEKGFDHCGLCDEYPCERFEAMLADSRPHCREIPENIARLQKVGAEKWLEEQKERWTCTCGTSFSWYQGLCYSCGEAVPSYEN